MFRFSILFIVLISTSSCKHFSNSLEETKLQCGSEVNNDLDRKNIFRIKSGDGNFLHRSDVQIQSIGESNGEGRLTEKGCAVLTSGKWLVFTNDRNSFGTVDIADPNKGSEIILNPTNKEIPNLQCPAPVIGKTYLLQNLISGLDNSEIPYFRFRAKITKPESKFITDTPYLWADFKRLDLVSGLQDGKYSLHVDFLDQLHGQNKGIDCSFEVDSIAPLVKLELNSIPSKMLFENSPILIPRDQLIRFSKLNPQDRDDPINIEFCFKNITRIDTAISRTDECRRDIRKATINEPIAPPQNEGIWDLQYRSFDNVGNSTSWSRPTRIVYIDTTKQKTIIDNSRADRLDYIWSNGTGIIALIKTALSNYKIWKGMNNEVEKNLVKHNLISTLYAALIGYQLNGTVISAPARVDKIVLTKSGSIVFAGTDFGEIFKIDTHTGNILKKAKLFQNGISDLKISEDEKYLVVGSFDRRIAIVDPDNLTLLKQSDCCEGEFLRLALTHNGQKIISSSWDQKIKIWNFDAKLIREISKETSANFHTDVIMGLAISSDDKTLYTASWDHSVRHWNIENGEFIKKSDLDHTDGINAIGIIPSSQMLVTGSKDGGLYVHDAPTGKLIWKTSIGSSITALSNSDSGIVATGSLDNQIRTWDLNTLKEFGSAKKVESFGMGNVGISGDGSIVLSTTFSPIMRIWDNSNQNSFSKSLIGHAPNVSIRALATIQKNESLYSGASDGNIIKWNLKTSLPTTVLKAHTDTVYDLIEGKDGHLISFSKDSTIKDHSADLQTNTIPTSYPNEWKYSGAYIPLTETIVYGTWNGLVNSVNLTGTAESNLAKYIGWYRVKYIPSTDLLLAVSRTKIIQLFRGHDLTFLKKYDGFSEAVTAVDFDPVTGNIFASLYNGEIAIRNVQNDSSSSINTGANILWDLKLSSDGKILITGGNDGKLMLWDSEFKNQIGISIMAHSKALRVIKLSDDEGTIYTGSDDGSVKSWAIPVSYDPEKIRNEICKNIINFRDEKWFNESDSSTSLSHVCE